MAIRVTIPVTTSEGVISTGTYFNLDELFRNKAGDITNYTPKYYTNEDKVTPCEVFHAALKKAFTPDVSGTIDSAKDSKLAYDAIGAELFAAGLSPESDETGSWVAYS